MNNGNRRTTVKGVYDNFGSFIGAVPEKLVSITADTEITDYSVIAPTADVNIYYVDAPSVTAVLNANNAVGVNSDLRLSSDTVCWVA